MFQKYFVRDILVRIAGILIRAYRQLSLEPLHWKRNQNGFFYGLESLGFRYERLSVRIDFSVRVGEIFYSISMEYD